MARANRSLVVWANGVRVGVWHLPSRGAMEFRYDESWVNADEARPLSLSLPLPLQGAPCKGAAVEGYFDNLLPDSEPIRQRLQDRFHASSRGAFDLLTAIGRDCVGAVQLLPEGETPADIRKIDAVPLSDAAIARALAGVTSRGRAQDDDGDFRISIAGAQEKTALLRHQGKWCRPAGSTPTTHIFKLPLGLVGNRQADMRTSVENEWLCSHIFAAYGLPIARCEIGEFGTQKALIVERFDRVTHSSGKYWLRLMQEDLCQATATPAHRKYQADGGPGLEKIASVLRNSVESRRDLETLFRAQLLFWMLAATDGHAKNFSIRIHPGGSFQLTPLYDVLSAWPIVGDKANEIPIEKIRLAMAMPGGRPRYHVRGIQARHFDALARKLGIATDAAALIADTIERTPAAIDEVQSNLPKGFPQTMLDRMLGGLGKSAKTLHKSLEKD